MKRKKKKAVKFTLKGKPFDPTGRAPAPSEARLIVMLEALPDGTLLDTHEVCGRAGMGRMTFFTNLRAGRLDAYRLELDSRKVYYGNARTIALAQKELKNRENH